MTCRFKADGTLTPSSSRAQIGFSFLVPPDAERMEIAFSYKPKKLADEDKARELILSGIAAYGGEEAETMSAEWETCLPVLNLLTVSVDDPRGFRGCVHRHSPAQELLISPEEASPGLIRGPLPGGYWKVTISVHSVVTDRCDYSIEVKA